jgi:coenzyme F420-0:L-glutamate ligase/coenzyme F420-1:gamma-L-glutamate ligase
VAGIARSDHRGQTDPYGNELQITQVAVVDELAAAELVKGKVDEVPVAVVRYLNARLPRTDRALAMIRDAASDMFSLGTAEAHAGGRTAARHTVQIRLAAGDLIPWRTRHSPASRSPRPLRYG